MHKMAFQSFSFSKFSGRACPQTLPEVSPFGTQVSVSCLLHETSPLLPKLMGTLIHYDRFEIIIGKLCDQAAH